MPPASKRSKRQDAIEIAKREQRFEAFARVFCCHERAEDKKTFER